ncbi:glycoside hydrolase family 43 protein [Marinoscillum luteum]|uniref:Family 43 glycosylhydrolase n=1 Tax=Marinoscillum luteum TaxID=861051 RepID=A0ABW7NBQ4_9BACT
MQMLRAVLVHLVGILLFGLTACAEEGSPKIDKDPPKEEPTVDSLFLNPVHTSGPDPWVFQKDDHYYLTFTTGINVTLYKTDVMSDLSKAYQRVVWTPPASGPNSRNIWAPEIHFIRDKWYIYYAADDGNNDNHRMFVLENSSADPTVGQWVDKGELKLPGDRWAIDGTIFEHADQLYYLWSGWSGATNGRQDLYICKMTDPYTAEGDRVLLTKPELSWETNGTNPTVVEGPQVLKNGDKLFMIYSAGGCWTDGYSLGMLTAAADADLMTAESWVKSPNPVFSQNPSGNAFGPGHNGFFKSLDGTEDWIIYHANPFEGQGCGGARSIRIQPFTWDQQGYPDFGTPHPLYQKLTRPSGEY